MGLERRPSIVGKSESCQHRTLRIALAGRGLVRGERRVCGGEPLGIERLELDGICPGVCGGVDQLVGDRDIAVVIHAGLGDHEARAIPDDVVRDRYVAPEPCRARHGPRERQVGRGIDVDGCLRRDRPPRRPIRDHEGAGLAELTGGDDVERSRQECRPSA